MVRRKKLQHGECRLYLSLSACINTKAHSGQPIWQNEETVLFLPIPVILSTKTKPKKKNQNLPSNQIRNSFYSLQSQINPKRPSSQQEWPTTMQAFNAGMFIHLGGWGGEIHTFLESQQPLAVHSACWRWATEAAQYHHKKGRTGRGNKNIQNQMPFINDQGWTSKNRGHVTFQYYQLKIHDRTHNLHTKRWGEC